MAYPSLVAPGVSALCAREQRVRANARAWLRDGTCGDVVMGVRAAFLLDTCANIIDRAQRDYYHTAPLVAASARYYRAVGVCDVQRHVNQMACLVDELNACTALGSMLVAADALCRLASMAASVGPLAAGMRALLRMVVVRNGLPVNPASGEYLPFDCVPSYTLASRIISAMDVASVEDRAFARQFAVQYALRARWCNQRCDSDVVALAEGWPTWPSLFTISISSPEECEPPPPPDDNDSAYGTESPTLSPLLSVSFIEPLCSTNR